MADPYFLPRGITGFGVESSRAEQEARRMGFLSWSRSVGSAGGSTVAVLPLAEPWPSFDSVYVERLGVWILHNRYVRLVGAISTAPEPAPSWAVGGDFVDFAIPDHVAGWGPEVLDSCTLNAPLESHALNHLGFGAQEQADRYKPVTVGHVLFNYWS